MADPVIQMKIGVGGTYEDGSRTDISVGDTVYAYSKEAATSTYLWELVSAPVGSAATLSATTTREVHFTADLVGTYLLKLTLDSTSVDKKGCAILMPSMFGNFRMPAYYETHEFDAAEEYGWMPMFYDFMRDALGAAGSLTKVKNSSGASLYPGMSVFMTGAQDAAGIVEVTVTNVANFAYVFSSYIYVVEYNLALASGEISADEYCYVRLAGVASATDYVQNKPLSAGIYAVGLDLTQDGYMTCYADSTLHGGDSPPLTVGVYIQAADMLVLNPASQELEGVYNLKTQYALHGKLGGWGFLAGTNVMGSGNLRLGTRWRIPADSAVEVPSKGFMVLGDNEYNENAPACGTISIKRDTTSGTFEILRIYLPSGETISGFISIAVHDGIDYYAGHFPFFAFGNGPVGAGALTGLATTVSGGWTGVEPTITGSFATSGGKQYFILTADCLAHTDTNWSGFIMLNESKAWS